MYCFTLLMYSFIHCDLTLQRLWCNINFTAFNVKECLLEQRGKNGWQTLRQMEGTGKILTFSNAIPTIWSLTMSKYGGRELTYFLKQWEYKARIEQCKSAIAIFGTICWCNVAIISKTYVHHYLTLCQNAYTRYYLRAEYLIIQLFHLHNLETYTIGRFAYPFDLNDHDLNEAQNIWMTMA